MALKTKRTVTETKHVVIYNRELTELDKIVADWLNQGYTYQDCKILQVDHVNHIFSILYIFVKYATEE
mgnify:CR=1 FL=1